MPRQETQNPLPHAMALTINAIHRVELAKRDVRKHRETLEELEELAVADNSLRTSLGLKLTRLKASDEADCKRLLETLRAAVKAGQNEERFVTITWNSDSVSLTSQQIGGSD